jgi:hypothetical protein
MSEDKNKTPKQQPKPKEPKTGKASYVGLNRQNQKNLRKGMEIPPKPPKKDSK